MLITLARYVSVWLFLSLKCKHMKNKKVKFIKIALDNGKMLDIVEKAAYAESELYVTFKNFEKIKKYISANNTTTPINDSTFNNFMQAGLIQKKAKRNE